MKIQDTISVNPSKTALGHSESSVSGIFRSQVINQEAHESKVDFLSFVFPTTNFGISSLKNFSLPLRALFSTILIVAGLTILENSVGFHSAGFGIVEIIFGGFLALGLLTRPVMFGAAVYFAISAALSIRYGNADITSLALMFGCFVFSVTGSGKYSLDLLLRKSVKKAIKNHNIKKADLAMGYKAFHYAK